MIESTTRTAFGLYQYYTAHAGSLRPDTDEIASRIVLGKIVTMCLKETVDFFSSGFLYVRIAINMAVRFFQRLSCGKN